MVRKTSPASSAVRLLGCCLHSPQFCEQCLTTFLHMDGNGCVLVSLRIVQKCAGYGADSPFSLQRDQQGQQVDPHSAKVHTWLLYPTPPRGVVCKTAMTAKTAVRSGQTLGFTRLARDWACHQLSTHTTISHRTMLRHELRNCNAPWSAIDIRDGLVRAACTSLRLSAGITAWCSHHWGRHLVAMPCDAYPAIHNKPPWEN